MCLNKHTALQLDWSSQADNISSLNYLSLLTRYKHKFGLRNCMESARGLPLLVIVWILYLRFETDFSTKYAFPRTKDPTQTRLKNIYRFQRAIEWHTHKASYAKPSELWTRSKRSCFRSDFSDVRVIFFFFEALFFCRREDVVRSRK